MKHSPVYSRQNLPLVGLLHKDPSCAYIHSPVTDKSTMLWEKTQAYSKAGESKV